MSFSRFKYPEYELKYAEEYANSSFKDDEFEECVDSSSKRAESEYSDSSPKYAESEEGSIAACSYPCFKTNSEAAKLNSNADVAVEQACLEIRIAYSFEGVRRSKGANIDFSQDLYQKAYVGRYLGMHLTLIKTELSYFFEVSGIFRKWLKNHGSLNVCSIGGGPGTDIMGLSLFFEALDLPNLIDGTIFDLFNWERLFKSLLQRVDKTQQRVSKDIHIVPYDFFDVMPKSLKRRLQSFDLVTMIKFVSVITDDPHSCMAKLREYLSLMKPGAILFYIDNSGGDAFHVLSEVAEICDMRVLARFLHKTIPVCPELVERLQVSRNCCSNCNPQSYTKVSGALYQKM